MGKWREEIDKVMHFISKHSPLKWIDFELWYRSGLDSYSNPTLHLHPKAEDAYKDWHWWYLFTHPILFIKNFICNHRKAVILIVAVLVFVALVMTGVVPGDLGTICGVGLVAVFWIVFLGHDSDGNPE